MHDDARRQEARLRDGDVGRSRSVQDRREDPLGGAGAASPGPALTSGRLGRLNAVNGAFDPNDRYNLWSGLIGGFFLQLSYFGTDQSQVGRYLTGRSLTEFVVSSAQEVAARTVREHEVLTLSGRDRQIFVDALLKPILPNKRLRQAARRYKSVS